jgi:hypothetical protein
MFDLFKKKSSADIAKTIIPAPIDGREGHVGGIEPLILDGVTYYFGFDYGSDLVVSPLMSDIDVMAQFASQHMQQRDGSHDAVYWLELAGYGSELCSDEVSRTFNSQDLTATVAALRHSRENNVVATGIHLEYHLRYLLASAGEWKALEEWGDEWDDTDEYIAMISGETPLPAETSFADLAQKLQSLLAALMNSAPENWRTLFSVLKP